MGWVRLHNLWKKEGNTCKGKEKESNVYEQLYKQNSKGIKSQNRNLHFYKSAFPFSSYSLVTLSRYQHLGGRNRLTLHLLTSLKYFCAHYFTCARHSAVIIYSRSLWLALLHIRYLIIPCNQSQVYQTMLSKLRTFAVNIGLIPQTLLLWLNPHVTNEFIFFSWRFGRLFHQPHHDQRHRRYYR